MKMSKKALETKGSSTISITTRAKYLQTQGKDIIGFTAGEPDFPTPEHIKNAGIDAIKNNFTTYTQNSGINELKLAICEKLKLENNLDYIKEDIIVSNGAKHSLINTFIAILDEGDEVIIPVPYWVSYKSMVTIAGGTPIFSICSEKNDYKPTIEELEKCISKKTKAIILNSPCNPTGAVYTKQEIIAYANFVKKHDLIAISDEIYEKLIYDEDFKHISIASIEGMKARTIVINGFSKSYAMTGWRMGYLAAPTEVSKAINNIQSHMTSNASSITQMAALAALAGGNDCVTKMRESFKLRRDYIYNRVSKMPMLKCVKPHGAFYLFVDISQLCGKKVGNIEIKNSADFAEILINDYGVCVIPCEDFGSPKHVRLSYAISLENIEKGLDRIEKFLNDIM